MTIVMCRNLYKLYEAGNPGTNYHIYMAYVTHDDNTIHVLDDEQRLVKIKIRFSAPLFRTEVLKMISNIDEDKAKLEILQPVVKI